MANPDFLDILGEEMGNVYAATHDRLLVNLARHFKYVKDEIISEPNASFRYQAKKLAEMGQVTKESVDIIMKMMGGGDEALRDTLEAAILDSLDDIEPALRAAAREGLLNGGQIPPEVPTRTRQAFTSYYQQSADRMNLVNSNMLQSTEEAFRSTVSDITNRMQRAQRIVNAATGELIVGADSFNMILKDATRKMVSNGIPGFIDSGGHKWAPETYIAMAMRTTYHNASRTAFFERNAEYSNDLYLVSQHPGARPLCYPWQCKVISRANNRRWETDGAGQPVQVWAQDETTFGEPAGLFGINCGHYPLPFIPGVTKVPELRQGEEENAKQYAESQKQRELERDFRKARLDLDVAKAQGADAETIKAAKAKIRDADSKLNRFCADTGRKRRREREYPPMNAKWPDPPVSEKARLHTTSPETVSEQGLDAEGFTEKFEGITGKKAVDAAIKNSAVEMLQHRGGTNREDLHLIDGDTGEVIHKLTTSDEMNGVTYDTETLEALQQAREAGRKIIAVHNHPNGLPPTLDDGASAYARGYDLGIAVGHNLEVWTYSKANAAYTAPQLEEAQEEIAKAIRFSVDFEDEVWYNVLEIYGMKVRRR